MTEEKIKRMKHAHRRLGALVALFLILLAGSGILLNHSDDLGLVEHPISPLLAEWLYDVEQVTGRQGFELSGQWWYSAGDMLETLDRRIGGCENLLGAVRSESLVVALCSDSLFLTTPMGDLIEQVALPLVDGIHPDRIGDSNMQVILGQSDALYAFDPDALQTTPLIEKPAVVWPVSDLLPADILPATAVMPELNLERLILDIHSGRILGRWHTLFMDLLAALMLLLAIGGIVMWASRRP